MLWARGAGRSPWRKLWRWPPRVRCVSCLCGGLRDQALLTRLLTRTHARAAAAAAEEERRTGVSAEAKAAAAAREKKMRRERRGGRLLAQQQQQQRRVRWPCGTPACLPLTRLGPAWVRTGAGWGGPVATFTSAEAAAKGEAALIAQDEGGACVPSVRHQLTTCHRSLRVFAQACFIARPVSAAGIAGERARLCAPSPVRARVPGRPSSAGARAALLPAVPGASARRDRCPCACGLPVAWASPRTDPPPPSAGAAPTHAHAHVAVVTKRHTCLHRTRRCCCCCRWTTPAPAAATPGTWPGTSLRYAPGWLLRLPPPHPFAAPSSWPVPHSPPHISARHRSTHTQLSHPVRAVLASAAQSATHPPTNPPLRAAARRAFCPSPPRSSAR